MSGFRTDHDGPRWSLDSFHGGYSGHHIEFSRCSKAASPPRTSHPVASPFGKTAHLSLGSVTSNLSMVFVQFHRSSFLKKSYSTQQDLLKPATNLQSTQQKSAESHGCDLQLAPRRHLQLAMRNNRDLPHISINTRCNTIYI